MAQVFRFLPGRFRLLAVAEPDKDSVQGAWMTAVRFFLPQLAVQFANAAVGISAVVVPDPSQFLLCVCIGVWAVRTM